MILIAPDKFKGSLTAREAAEAMAQGLRDGGCRDEIVLRPMADGGEGMPATLGGKPVVSSCDYVGAANERLAAQPVMERSSAPLGRRLLTLKEENRTPLLLGVGGTLTTDGGAGALQALGVRFYDHAGRLITNDMTPAMLLQIGSCDFDSGLKEYWRLNLTVLSDVRATLTGPGLSSLDFAKQKGVTESEMPWLKSSLEHLRHILGSPAPSAADGAGGGIGFAFSSFLGAPCKSGAEAMISATDIDWRRVKLVISGEGSIDSQTAGGKVVAALRREAERHGVRFIAIGGYVEPSLRDATTISTIAHREDYNPATAAARLRQSTAAVARSLMSADEAPTIKSHSPF